MPRKAIGDRPMTPAERQARRQQRKQATVDNLREALASIMAASTLRQARKIAAGALLMLPQRGPT